MHQAVIDFVSYVSQNKLFDGASVVEVGAQNVNGRAMDAASGTPKQWIGIDLVAGPDVHHVGDATIILPILAEQGEQFDIAISTEVLEHAEGWKEIVTGLVTLLRSGGHLILTCAGPGRPEHSSVGNLDLNGEYYKNVSISEIEDVLGDSMRTIIGESKEQDTRYFGIKK